MCQKEKLPKFFPLSPLLCVLGTVCVIFRRFAPLLLNISRFSEKFRKTSEKIGEEIRNFWDGGGEKIRVLGQNI